VSHALGEGNLQGGRVAARRQEEGLTERRYLYPLLTTSTADSQGRPIHPRYAKHQRIPFHTHSELSRSGKGTPGHRNNQKPRSGTALGKLAARARLGPL
jgi:hypothetical protein